MVETRRSGLRATPRKTEHYGNMVETPAIRRPNRKSQFFEDLGDDSPPAADNLPARSPRGRQPKANGAIQSKEKLNGSIKADDSKKKKVIIDGWEVGTDPKFDSNPVFEFGGNFGVTAMMICFPLLMWYMFVGATYYNGKFPTREEGESYPAFFGHLASLAYNGAFPSVKAWTIYWTFFLLEMLAYCFLPGITTEGKPLAHEGGKRLQYYCSAMWSFYATILITAVLHFTGLFPLYTLLDEFGPIMSVSIISGFLVSIIAYFSAIYRGAQHRMTGYFLYDFFMGAELNPRIGRLDFKMFFEVRLPWYILLGMSCAAAARQYEQYGYVSGEVCLLIMAHYLYANACSKGEECIPPTWDMYFEKWGFMLIFWNMAGVPLSYCHAALYLANNPPSTYQMPRPLLYLLFATYLFVYWIWDTTNSQKNRFRQEELGGPTLQRKAFPQLPWQVVKNPRIIRNASGDSILADGWYGYARKIHYTCDFFFALSWALVTGFESPFPWFYPVFFAGMIVHRANRDIEKCRKKYGESWTEYEKLVPYLFFPYVF